MANFKLPSLHAKIDMNADVDASKRRWSPSFSMKTCSADTESAATGNLWPKQPTQSAMQGLWAARVNQSMAKTYNRYAHTQTGRFCKWPNAGSTAFSITLTHSAIEAGLGATVLELWSPGSTSSMTEVQQQIRHSFFFVFKARWIDTLHTTDAYLTCIWKTDKLW